MKFSIIAAHTQKSQWWGGVESSRFNLTDFFFSAHYSSASQLTVLWSCTQHNQIRAGSEFSPTFSTCFLFTLDLFILNTRIEIEISRSTRHMLLNVIRISKHHPLMHSVRTWISQFTKQDFQLAIAAAAVTMCGHCVISTPQNGEMFTASQSHI